MQTLNTYSENQGLPTSRQHYYTRIFISVGNREKHFTTPCWNGSTKKEQAFSLALTFVYDNHAFLVFFSLFFSSLFCYQKAGEMKIRAMAVFPPSPLRFRVCQLKSVKLSSPLGLRQFQKGLSCNEKINVFLKFDETNTLKLHFLSYQEKVMLPNISNVLDTLLCKTWLAATLFTFGLNIKKRLRISALSIL